MDAGVQDIIDHRILDRFRLMRDRNRLAHAYLLIGPQGRGKLATALAVARMLNCTSDGVSPCGGCEACLKIMSNNHPDVLVCDRGEDKEIKIDKVRTIIERMQLRPYEAMMKIIIIPDADRFRMEAANAFLKTLEEPTANSLLLLITALPERIPDTIRSRCQAVPFSTSARSCVADQLVRSGIPSMDAKIVAGFAEGCYGRAKQLQEEGFLDRKNQVIDQFMLGQVDDKLLKLIVSDTARARETLDTLLFCFKDVLLLKVQADQERITNQDRLDDLKKCAARYSVDQLRDILSAIVNTKKMLDGTLNVKVPFMVLKEKIWVSNAYRCN